LWAGSGRCTPRGRCPKYHGLPEEVREVPDDGKALFGWLLTRVNPAWGMWGQPTFGQAALRVVNGYYRLTRGSFAQFAPIETPSSTTAFEPIQRHHRCDPFGRQWLLEDRQVRCHGVVEPRDRRVRTDPHAVSHAHRATHRR